MNEETKDEVINEEVEEINNEEEVILEKKSKKENKKDKEIEELKKEIEELKNKNIRVTADMVNTIRRKEEEMQKMLKYSNETLIEELLVVMDNFERALDLNVDGAEELSNYQKGINMIYSSIKNILEKEDVKEIESLGKEFDPNLHQAVMQVEESDKESNIIIEVMQKGYTYKDKVIRPAMVKVSK